MEFDRNEWVGKLRKRASKAPIEITLRPNGVGLAELKGLLGKEFACEELESGGVRIGLKQKVEPSPE